MVAADLGSIYHSGLLVREVGGLVGERTPVMPYKIQKRGSQWCVVRKDTGESKGCSSSAAEAKKHLAALYANEPKAGVAPSAAQTEQVTLAMRHASTAVVDYKPRRESFEGRPHLAVPVVMLVEGVVHAINAETPELVTAKEFAKQPNGWNGRPLYHGHPMKNGKPVSGNLPEVLAKSKVGTLFNVKANSSKLQGEAWVDEQNCKERAPELLERVLAGEPIEISVGAFVDTIDEKGTWDGKDYKGVWKDIIPDHLALLPSGDEGACSRKMGCGIRANKADLLRDLYSPDQSRDEKGRFGSAAANHEAAAKAHSAAAKAQDKADSKASTHTVSQKNAHIDAHTKAHVKTLKAEKATAHANASSKNLVNTSHGQHATNAARSASNASRAGNHREASGEHRQAADYHKALANLIRGAGDTAGALKDQKVEQKLRASGGNVAEEKTQETGSRFAKLMQQARDFFRVSQSADEMSDATLRKQLSDALSELEGNNLLGVEAFEPVTDPSCVIYRMYEPGEPTGNGYGPMYGPGSTCLYSMDFKLSDKGVVTLDKESKKEVQAVTVYDPVEDDDDEDSPEDLMAAKEDLKNAAGGANQFGQQAAAASSKAAGHNAKGNSTKAAKAHTDAAQAHGAAMQQAAKAGDAKGVAAHAAAMTAHTQAAVAHVAADAGAAKATQSAVAATNKAVAAPVQKNASGQKPCGCGTPKVAEGEQSMKTREQRIAKLMNCERNPVKDQAILESLSDDQLKTLRKYTKGMLGGAESKFVACGTKKEAEAVISKMADAHTALHSAAADIAAKAATKNAADSRVPPAGQDSTTKGGEAGKVNQSGGVGGAAAPKAAEAHTPTFDELLAAADSDTQAAIKAATASAKAKKDAAIKSLKSNPKNKFTDAQLQAMPVDQLENLVALTGGEIRDFSGASTSRTDSDKKEVAPAPDLGEAIRTARAKK